MKNKIFALIIALFTVISTTAVVNAEEYSLLQDMSGLLSESEAVEIEALLEEVSERQGMDIVIMTVDAVEEGLTVEEDATEWYEYLGYANDGAMLYVSVEEGDWYYLTKGFGITAMTDAGIDYISEKFIPYMSDGDFAESFRTFIEYTDEFVTQAKTGKPYDNGNMPKEPYNFFMSLVISVIIGFVVSLIINSMWKSKLTSVVHQTRATSYLKQGSLNITNSRDLFLYKTIDRREKSRESSSGGSSTHTSSSGGTYGGKGGKF